MSVDATVASFSRSMPRCLATCALTNTLPACPCPSSPTSGAHVHISRVLIRNFRNFKDLEINPFPRHAVIVGENGVGKSNLLHALRLPPRPGPAGERTSVAARGHLRSSRRHPRRGRRGAGRDRAHRVHRRHGDGGRAIRLPCRTGTAHCAAHLCLSPWLSRRWPGARADCGRLRLGDFRRPRGSRNGCPPPSAATSA